MENTNQLTFLVLIAISHLIIGVVFSKTIFQREPSFKKRALLLSVLWLVPLLGVIAVYKVLDLGWFKNADGSRGSGAVSIGFLEMDAVFNPGGRHLIEEKQKERVEVQKEGEMYKRPGSDIDSIGPNSNEK